MVTDATITGYPIDTMGHRWGIDGGYYAPWHGVLRNRTGTDLGTGSGTATATEATTLAHQPASTLFPNTYANVDFKAARSLVDASRGQTRLAVSAG